LISSSERTPLSRALETSGVVAGFFAVALLAAFHAGFDKEVVLDPSGVPTDGKVIGAAWSVEQVLAHYGGTTPETKYRKADLASYLAAGEYLLSDGSWEPDYLQLWTPGFPILIAAVIGTFGRDAYLMKMALVSVFAWTAALFAVFQLLQFGKNRWVRFAALSSLFLLPSFREWTFGFGSVMTESSSSAAFVVALALLARAIVERKVALFAASGLALGVATLLRSYYLFIANAMLGYTLAVLLVGWIAIRSWPDRKISPRALLAELLGLGPWKTRPRTVATRYLIGFAIAFAVFAAALEPWRIYKYSRTKTSALVAVPLKYNYFHSWQPQDQVPYFMKAGNAACSVDPALCKVVWDNRDSLSGQHFRNLVIMTIVAHPIAYAALKLRLFNWLWFGREWRYILFEEPWMALEGFAFLGLGAFGLARLARAYRRTRAVELAVWGIAVTGFIAINAAVFGAYTYEWRYSHGMRVCCFFLPFAVLALERALGSRAPRSPATLG
jgi:hypothetical protein